MATNTNQGRTIHEVVWLCNGRDKNCSKMGCYYKMHSGRRGPCMHTSNPKYAKNKPRDPKRYPQYFDRYKSGDTVRYYEREEPK